LIEHGSNFGIASFVFMMRAKSFILAIDTRPGRAGEHTKLACQLANFAHPRDGNKDLFPSPPSLSMVSICATPTFCVFFSIIYLVWGKGFGFLLNQLEKELRIEKNKEKH